MSNMIVCSCRDAPDFMIECIDNGAADFIVKPIRLEVVKSLFLVRGVKTTSQSRGMALIAWFLECISVPD